MNRPNPSPAEIVAALQRGGVVEALKLVVAAKRAGSAAEKTEAELGTRATGPSKRPRSLRLPGKTTELSPGEVPRSNGDVWLLLLAAAALLVGYYFFAA